MSRTSPGDLAVTFRSIPRRLKAAQGHAPDRAVAGPAGEIGRHVQSAAALLRAKADPESVAEAIESRPADAWDDAELDALRANALEIGALLRTASELGEHDEDGG
jgi:hypothetical protein